MLLLPLVLCYPTVVVQLLRCCLALNCYSPLPVLNSFPSVPLKVESVKDLTYCQVGLSELAKLVKPFRCYGLRVSQCACTRERALLDDILL